MNFTPRDLVLLGGTVVLLGLAAWRLPRGGIGRFQLVAGPMVGCIVAACLAFFIEASARELIHLERTIEGLLTFALIISTTEEVLRFLVFLTIRRRASRILDPREWITQGVVLGLAFSLFENILFAGARLLDWRQALLRLGITTASHAAYASVVALESVRRNFQCKPFAGSAGLLIAILLHATFDFAEFSLENFRSPPNEVLIRALQIVIVYGSLGFVWVKTHRFLANERTSNRLGEPVA